MQLNVEQKKIIQSKPAGHYLLKGVAGSGKTTVAVNRIPFLMSNYCFEKDDRVLMVTFNKTLKNYIKFIYEKVDEENKYAYLSLFETDKSKIDIVTIDSLIYKYFIEYNRQNKSKVDICTDRNKLYAVLSNCVAEINKLYPKVKIIDYGNIVFLKDELEWIKSCGYTELEEYQNTDRLGRMSNGSNDGPQRLLKNSEVRNAIFDLMKLYNKKLGEENLIDFKDMSVLALTQAKKKIINKYTHIIIDESQDLTKIQLEFIKTLYNNKKYSSILFVADTAQSIYPHSWLVKGRSFTSIGLDMTGKSNSLAKNYRTTTQIAEAAYSLIDKDPNITEDDNFVKPSLIDKQGVYPTYRCFRDSKKEISYIINEIKNKLIPSYDYRDIVIIARNRNQLVEVDKVLELMNIPCRLLDNKQAMEFEKNEVKLLTMHSVKGLEFPVVFIIGLNSNTMPYYSYQNSEDKSMQESMERKLLYVGMTRANEIVYLTSNREPSKFIKDIDYKFLKINRKSKIKKFHEIDISNYFLKDDIIDLYSNEEKIRQWIISELIETYKFPKDLIDVEYKVNNFSKQGSVDVVVKIYSNKIKIPYIFIEVKREGMGTEAALGQLKSYMNVSKNCHYGIATDGNEFKVIDKEFNEIEDIPCFDNSMLPSSMEEYEYIDLRHKDSKYITRDGEDIKNIALNIDGNENLFQEDDLRKLNIYSNIAAGIPIMINSERGGEFFLPKEWFSGMEDVFILKVRGDSMKGALIDDGDLIIIEKQETAANRSIVAVDIEGNATLKRFTRMGDTILLISENENYEPIQITSEEARIIGLAIGVLKYKS
ncbi:MAG: S24 family peptidase [Clostridiaceae bacterium]